MARSPFGQLLIPRLQVRSLPGPLRRPATAGPRRSCSAQVVVGNLNVERPRHRGLDDVGDALVPALLLRRCSLQKRLDLIDLNIREADRHDRTRVVKALAGHYSRWHAES